MFKSIILTVAMMTAPVLASAQWTAHPKVFKKVNNHTRLLKGYSSDRIRCMVTLILTNNGYILDTMIFSSKERVPFFMTWESAYDVKTMAVVKDDNGDYDMYLFHHRREEKFYFSADGINYGYLP